MGLVQDISSLIRKGPELAGQLDSIKLNTKSIARGAKDSTFQFPCLVVDTISIDMANTIARTLDQVYATFTQTWLSMNSMFDMSIDPTPLSYLRKLHQNLKIEGVDNLVVDDEDISDYMEKVYDGKYKLYMNEEGTYGILFNVADHATREMMESHKDLLREYMSEYNLNPVEAVMEANNPTASDLANAMINGQAKKNERDRLDKLATHSEKQSAPKLLDRDIRKSNDLTPYGIQVRLIAVNDKKEFVQYIDFIVGVKTILHPVSSSDMTDNIMRALQNKNLAFKLLRWTTGEISLFKDIIFNINDIKTDALNKQNNKSPFFATLKRLKDRKIGFHNGTVPHALIPNTTVVITSYEADYLNDNYAIDVRDEKIAKKLLSAMFLMSFIIVDEGTETISILYDGDETFQVYALETLERENNANSNKLGREIGRMISH